MTGSCPSNSLKGDLLALECIARMSDQSQPAVFVIPWKQTGVRTVYELSSGLSLCPVDLRPQFTHCGFYMYTKPPQMKSF